MSFELFSSSLNTTSFVAVSVVLTKSVYFLTYFLISLALLHKGSGVMIHRPSFGKRIAWGLGWVIELEHWVVAWDGVMRS